MTETSEATLAELKKLHNSLCCVVCMDLFKEPVTTTCGHSFCQHCIEKVTKVPKSVCPLCKAAVTRRHVIKNPKIKALVSVYTILAKELTKSGLEIDFLSGSDQSVIEVSPPKLERFDARAKSPSGAHPSHVDEHIVGKTSPINIPKSVMVSAPKMVEDGQVPSTSHVVMSTPPPLPTSASRFLQPDKKADENDDPYTFVPSQRPGETKRSRKRSKSNPKSAKAVTKKSPLTEKLPGRTGVRGNARNRQEPAQEAEFDVALFESQPAKDDGLPLEEIPLVTVPESPAKKRRGRPRRQSPKDSTARSTKQTDIDEKIESIRLLFDDVDKQELNILPASDAETHKENVVTKPRKKVTFLEESHLDKVTAHASASHLLVNRAKSPTVSSAPLTADSLTSNEPTFVEVATRAQPTEMRQTSPEKSVLLAVATAENTNNVKRSSPGWSRLQEMQQELAKGKKGHIDVAIKQGRDSLSKSIQRLPKSNADIEPKAPNLCNIQPVPVILHPEPIAESVGNVLPEPIEEPQRTEVEGNVEKPEDLIQRDALELPPVLVVKETQEVVSEPILQSNLKAPKVVEPDVINAPLKKWIFVQRGRLVPERDGRSKRSIPFHALGMLRKEKAFLCYGKRPFDLVEDTAEERERVVKKLCTVGMQTSGNATQKVFRETGVQTEEIRFLENAIVAKSVSDAKEPSFTGIRAEEIRQEDNESQSVVDSEPVNHVPLPPSRKEVTHDLEVPDTVPVTGAILPKEIPSAAIENEPVASTAKSRMGRTSILAASCALSRYSFPSTAQCVSAQADSSDESVISSPEKKLTLMERIRANNDDLYSSEAEGSPEPRPSHRIVAKTTPIEQTKKRKFRRIRTAGSSESDSDDDIQVIKQSKRDIVTKPSSAAKIRADMEKEVEIKSSQLMHEGDSEEILLRAVEEAKRELYEGGHVPAIEIVHPTKGSTTNKSILDGTKNSLKRLSPMAKKNPLSSPLMTSTAKSFTSPVTTHLHRVPSVVSVSSEGIPSPSQSILANTASAKTAERSSLSYKVPATLAQEEPRIIPDTELLDVFGEVGNNEHFSPFDVLPKSLETMELEAAVIRREEANAKGAVQNNRNDEKFDIFGDDDDADDFFEGFEAAEVRGLETSSAKCHKSLHPVGTTSLANITATERGNSVLPHLESPRVERTRIFESDDDLIEATPEDERNRSWKLSVDKSETIKSPQKAAGRSPLANINVSRQFQNESRASPKGVMGKVSGIVSLENSSTLRGKEASPLVKKLALMYTGLDRQDILAVQKLAQSFNLTVLPAVSDSVSHVIVKADENMTAERTLKYLYGVASGAWIVDIKWIMDSLKQGKLLPEAPYEVLDLDGEPGPRRGRQMKGTLFKGFSFCCVPPFTHITVENMNDMVRLCGSGVVSHLQDLQGLAPGSVPLIIAQSDAGVEHNSEDWLNKYGVASVSREWILDSISSYRVLPIRSYLLQDSARTVDLLKRQGTADSLLVESSLSSQEF